VNPETALSEIVEQAQIELHIVRGEQSRRTAARDHGHDFEQMQQSADRVDHLAHLLRRLDHEEFGDRWRKVSAHD
jgi:hypothetical protein